MRSRIGALLVVAVGLVGCATADPGLRARSATPVDVFEPVDTLPPVVEDTVPAPIPDPPVDSTVAPEPVDTLEPISDPNQIAPIPAGQFPLDGAKPPQPYDGYLIAALEDIQQYWRDNFPVIYGEGYPELEGGIWPVYPGKAGVPGCGTPETVFADIEGNAFYCNLGDFVAYDDTTLLPQLEAELGTSVIGVILAHEWGHAIQARARIFDDPSVLTVTTELQADCFAGSWAAHLSRGENPNLTFRDSEIRTGLSGMIAVADSPGSVSFDPSAHGSAFDRVGAFQDGYLNGVGQCATYIESPPTPLQFGYRENEFDQFGEAVDNAPFEDQADCNVVEGAACGIFQLLIPELNLYWAARVPDFTDLAILTYTGDPGSACSQLPSSVFLTAAFYCVGDGNIYVDADGARAYYDELGDFSVGYLLAYAWADAVQGKIGSSLEGEPRVLVNDCLVGAFTRTGLPPEFVPTPSENVSLSPGDLDEAVKTAIRIGDDSVDTDEVGTPFDKIDAFRAGVIGDLEGCQARIGG